MRSATLDETSLALTKIVEVLDSIQINYFVGGSLASGAHWEFRATNDIDIICSLKKEQVAEFVKRTSSNFYADEASILKAVNQERSFNLIHNETFVKIDCFTKISELETKEFSRTMFFN